MTVNHKNRIKDKKIPLPELIQRYGYRRAVVFFALALFFAMLIIVYNILLGSYIRQSIRDKSKVNALNTAKEVEIYLSSAADVVDITEYTVASLLSRNASDEEILRALTEETDAIENSVLPETTGLYGCIRGEYFDGLGWVPEEGYVPTERPWYTEAIQNAGEITYINPYFDLFSNEVVMTIAKALPDGKNVVAVDVTLGGMQDIIKDDFDGDSNDSRMVISSNGFVVAHTDDKERGRNYVEEKGTFGNIVFNKAIEAAGDYVTVSNRGHTYTIYDVPIGNGWTSISVIDSRDEYIPIIVLNTISFTAIVLTFVIFFVMMINMSRSTLQSKAKSSFLSNMSHEIRTPINTILGMNEVILRESKDDNIVGYARNINSSGHTLLGIINDILDFSKIESGKLEIMPSDYDLAVVLSELVNMIKPRLDDKGLKLVLDIDRNIPRLLRGDDVRFKQVAANILTNAVKYTDRGEITLKMDCKKENREDNTVTVAVSVKDTGRGIRKEDMNRIFSEFERIDEKKNRNIEGTGLGMAITKSLLSLMGTSLNVDSTYGKGSEFSFDIVQEVNDWTPIGEYEEAAKKSAEPDEEYHSLFTAPDARILVVDDTPLNIVVFTTLLEPTEVKIDTAQSGDEGLNLALSNKYDIIFLDHMMPGKDGIETLRELKSHEGNINSDTPVVCLTANAITGAREEYIDAGFDDYITKPIESKKLERMIADHLPKQKVNYRLP